MILQPIVENSVKHGVSDIDWKANIYVRVWREDNNVCVSVRDNGVGINQEVINEIYSSDNKVYDRDETSDNGVGLKNVISRLRLYYGVENVMQINSEGKDMGTEVVLLIPCQEGEDNV